MKGYIERPVIGPEIPEEFFRKNIENLYLQVQEEILWINKPTQEISITKGTTLNSVVVTSPRMAISLDGSGSVPQITNIISPKGYSGPLYLINPHTSGTNTWKIMQSNTPLENELVSSSITVTWGKTVTLIQRNRRWYRANS